MTLAACNLHAFRNVRNSSPAIAAFAALMFWLGLAAPAMAQNNAAFVSQTVATSMVANQTYAVSVTMTNSGTTTWTVGDFYLRSQNPEDNTKWDLNRVELPNAVAPSENVTFNFNVKPTLNGSTPFQWRMAEGTTSFGALSTNVNVSVSGTNSSQFISQSVPEYMLVPGQAYAVSVTMKNTGTNTWRSVYNYKLTSRNPADNTYWGFNRVELPNDVAPGEQVTFSFNATAPTTPGIYNFQWQMLREGVVLFGQASTNVAVTVGDVNNAAFVSQTVTVGMYSNQTYAASVTMRNNGGRTWAVGNHYLRSQNPQDNTKWDLNRVELPNAVAPGESVTFNFNVKPTIDGITPFQWRMAEGTTSFGAFSTNVNVPVWGTNNAAFVTQSVPEVMVPGQVYPVSVTMQNTGTNTWRTEYGYKLRSLNPTDNTNWGLNRVELPNDVAPGESVTFSFNATAPTTPGIYNFYWQMVREGIAAFGAASTNVQVSVGNVDNAQFVSQTVATSMVANQTYAVSVTLRNNGANPWTVGEYYLRSQNPEDNTKWDLNRVELPNAVAPGENVTFNFNVKPTLNGSTPFQWRMAQGAMSFGALTTNVNVSVSGTNNAAFVSQSGIASIMVPGQVYPVTITMQNTGTNTWTSEYGYKLRSLNPTDNTNWGLNRVELPNDVAPGEQVTFSFNATAPTTPGTYNFYWQMLREGIAAFGAASTNVAVSVNGVNDSSFLSQTVPEVMGTSQASAVSVMLRNTGTTTWTPGSYWLGSENPEANTTWGTNRAELPAPVAPGEIVTIEFNITSPAAVGAYNFQWRMVQNSARFGTFTENSSVTVSDTDGAAFVSQSVPEVMAPGQSYPVSVTLRNMGGTTWAPGTYWLGSENPEANTTWGTNQVNLAVPVGPGAYVTLGFNVTAPTTVGVYNFQWRMVNNSTRFGAFTTNFPVDVVQGQAQTLYFVHTDHLNTPRLVADSTGTTVWRWDQQEPFGSNPADEDPDANSVAFDLPLRLPGQRYDSETALHYNYFRDYDPSLGRYGESDPIGLWAGLNTYSYVSSGPLLAKDPRGLAKWTATVNSSFVFTRGDEVFDLTSECKCGYKLRTQVTATYFNFGFSAIRSRSKNVQFEDHFACPNAMAFDGGALHISLGAGIGDGKSFDLIVLGVATSPGQWSSFDQAFGLTAGVSVGSSSVGPISMEKCCELNL